MPLRRLVMLSTLMTAQALLLRIVTTASAHELVGMTVVLDTRLSLDVHADCPLPTIGIMNLLHMTAHTLRTRELFRADLALVYPAHGSAIRVLSL